MKSARHEKIIELIQQHDIDTQEELAARLNSAGFKVTQATVSRDIRALKLTKVAGKDGKSRYAVLSGASVELGDKYTRVLHDALTSIDVGQNMIVIRTVPGMAMGVAAALDALNWKEILGSIAGDDTVMCVARDNEQAQSVAERLKGILKLCLVHLHVRNLALIEDIEVEFGPGLNILTGETGAGKSILLGSMQLILGGRSAKDMIRTGASNALVELLFQVENPRAEASLREFGVETSEGQVLLTRKLMDGRSINKINGETCTVAQMKAVASCLLDIHGQHEHQSLLYQDKQLEILHIYRKRRNFSCKRESTDSI